MQQRAVAGPVSQARAHLHRWPRCLMPWSAQACWPAVRVLALSLVLGTLLAPGMRSHAAPATAFPLRITDALGRHVSLAAIPKRVVSISPANTESLFAIGAWALVVGVTTVDTYPPEVKTLPKVGGFVPSTLSVETVVSLQPDLVLAAGELQRPTIEALERVGVTVVAMEDPSTFEDVYAALHLLGRFTGHEQGATQVVEGMQARVARVQQAVATLPSEQRVRVFYEVYDQPLMTAGPATMIGQLLTIAGGINVFAEVSGRYPQVSAEEVVQRNPSCIMGLKGHKTALTPLQMAQRPGWQRIVAVQQHCVHLLDDDTVARPGPRLVDALEAMTKALYPGLLP